MDDPGPGDLYEVGSVVMILRMLKMPDGQVKILVQGLARAQIKSFVATEPFWRPAGSFCRKKRPVRAMCARRL